MGERNMEEWCGSVEARLSVLEFAILPKDQTVKPMEKPADVPVEPTTEPPTVATEPEPVPAESEKPAETE